MLGCHQNTSMALQKLSSLMIFPPITHGDGVPLYTTGSLSGAKQKPETTENVVRTKAVVMVLVAMYLCSTCVRDVELQLMTSWLSGTHHTEKEHKMQYPEHAVELVLTATLLPASKCCCQLAPMYLHRIQFYQYGMSLQLPRNQKVKMLILGYS